MKMFIFIGLLISLPASATNYYVSSSLGDDSWSGELQSQPKRTLLAVQNFIAAASPGDKVLLKRGDVWSDALFVESGVGTADAPITIGAYGCGKLPRLETNSDSSLKINIRGAYTNAPKYLIFKDLHITSALDFKGKGSAGKIIETFRPEVPEYITFSNILIDDLHSGLNIQANNITIEDSVIENNLGNDTGKSSGIFLKGDNAVIRNNTFENNGNVESWFDWHVYLSHGNGHTVTGNAFIGGSSGVKLRASNDSVISDNTFYGMNYSGISLGGDNKGGARNNLVERNMVSNTKNALVLSDQSGHGGGGITNVIVRNNIFHSSTTAGGKGNQKGFVTVTKDPATGIKIYNNLIWGVIGQASLYIENTNLPASVITNNIFHRADKEKAILWIKEDVLDGTILNRNYYSCAGCSLIKIGAANYTQLDAFRADHTGLLNEADGEEGELSLVNPPVDFHLNGINPLIIGKGTDMGDITDFDGKSNVDNRCWATGPFQYAW